MGKKYLALILVVAPVLPFQTCRRPHVSLSPTNLTFTAVVDPNGGASAPQTIAVKSDGNISATIGSISASSAFAETNDCPSSLPPGSTCTIQVTFSPNAVGVMNGVVTATTAGSPKAYLSGTGLAPVGFNPNSLDFGTVSTGISSAAQAVTLTNNQDKDLAISAINSSGDYLQINDCPASLAAGHTCTITVTFHPTATGTVPGALSVSTDALPGTQPVGLTGTGSGSVSSAVTISPSRLSFGNLEAGTVSAAKSLTLHNTSTTSTLSITSVNASGPEYTETDTCAGKSISPGGTCTIQVKFQPPADFAPISNPGAIKVVDSDGASPHVAGLSGTGVAPLSASSDVLDFGTLYYLDSAPPRAVTVTNNHNTAQDLTFTNAGIGSVVNSCPSTLASAAHCDLSVSFDANTSGGIGNLTGSVSIAGSSGGFLNPHLVSLASCVTDVRLTPPSLNFGAIAPGSTSNPQTATLFVNGVATFSGITITGSDASEFAIGNNTCVDGTSGECVIEVTLTPKDSKAKSAALTIADDHSCSPRQVTLSGGSSAGPFIVTVGRNVKGTGSGKVTSIPPGLSCAFTNGDPCSAGFSNGAAVTLTATPDADSHFTGWGDACSGTSTCVLDMSADKQVTAGFDLNPDLAVTFAGNVSGTVTSTPAGINCPTVACDARFAPGTVVTLTAQTPAGATFGGWGGACSGSTTCQVTLNTDQSVIATFTEPALNLSFNGNGSGTVTVNPGANICTTTPCILPFPSGTKVTMMAAPTSGTDFTGWGGACSGTGACSLTMSADQNVSVNFVMPDFNFTASPPSTNPVVVGGSSTFALSMTSIDSFASTITFTCTVSPTPVLAPTCSVPASVALPANGSASAQVRITTTGPSSFVTPLSLGRNTVYAVWLSILGLPLLFVDGSRRARRTLLGTLLVVVIIGIAFQIACSSSSSSRTPGTPPGDYTITVTATAGAMTHSVQNVVTVR
jgi:hypothetical protein